MKPLFMKWVGLSDEGHVEAGKTYKIVGKEREIGPSGKRWYTYLFVDDAGNVEKGASYLFLKPKVRRA